VFRLSTRRQQGAAPSQPTSTLRLTGHHRALDGVRGVAILMVLVYHFFPADLAAARGTLLHAWSVLADFGGAGVDLFFVLSGFLITGILLDARDTPGYFRNFYARRVLRIFPLYYGVLLAYFVLLPLLRHFSPNEQAVAHHQGWLWAYASNVFAGRFGDWQLSQGRLSFDHFWSLCVEEHFYLLWPVAVYLLSRRALTWCCGAMIAGALALRWALYARGDQTLAFYVWTPCRMDGLAMGALLALLARSKDEGAGVRRWALPVLVASGAWTVLTWNSPAHACVYGGSLVTLIAAAFLVLAVTGAPTHLLTRCLTSRPLTLFGKYSYGIYVLHLLLLRGVIQRVLGLRFLRGLIAHGDVTRAVVMLVIGLAVSAAAGWLSWHLFEKHFVKLKRHFEYRRPPRKPVRPVTDGPAPTRLAPASGRSAA
jgi:peptidoglycan/LPS O-acetylase OafA/YrhL